MENFEQNKFVEMNFDNLRFKGSFYKFSCESGYTLTGDDASYCDGNKWNSSKPECLGK